VSLRITLARGQRGPDPDAWWKSALDALVHAGLLTDDNRQGVELGPVEYDRGPHRKTVITLEDIP
jgi:Holliday junction resolvase RusA-like endonuclease